MVPAPIVRTDPRSRLEAAWEANRPGSRVDHAVIVLPSLSVCPTLLDHLGERVPVYEQRYLLTMLMLRQVPGARMVYVTALPPSPPELDYYARLASPGEPQGVLRRLQVVIVPDASPRPVAAKLLEHPEVLDQVRVLVADRPAYLEVWNVTADEAAVPDALGLPVFGAGPEHGVLGSKSAGRELFRRIGVPLPAGREDVRTYADVKDAIKAVRAEAPHATAVVVKHDSTCSGDGNTVVHLVDDQGAPLGPDALAQQLHGIPRWFWDDLAQGGVVEERIGGPEVASPSVQVAIAPDGQVEVVATHDQVLDAGGMRYQGCRFPADRGYAEELAAHGCAVGEALAARGVRGRLGVDFVAVPRPGRPVLGCEPAWDLCALEINLRKGGTTHPRDALGALVPGLYEQCAGIYRAADGTTRCYLATDNLLDPDLIGRPTGELIAAVARAGLAFDHARGTGVVLHMLAGLRVDGRIGYTAIGRDHPHADRLEVATRACLRRYATTPHTHYVDRSSMM